MATDPPQVLLNGLPRILHEMEAVCHLDRRGCAFPFSVGKGPALVPADHLGTRICLEQGGESFGGRIFEQVGHATAFEVDDNRSVRLPLALGPPIDANDLGLRTVWFLPVPGQAQQGIRAGSHPQTTREPCSSLATIGQANVPKTQAKPLGATCRDLRHLAQPLCKDSSPALLIETKEAASPHL